MSGGRGTHCPSTPWRAETAGADPSELLVLRDAASEPVLVWRKGIPVASSGTWVVRSSSELLLLELEILPVFELDVLQLGDLGEVDVSGATSREQGMFLTILNAHQPRARRHWVRPTQN